MEICPADTPWKKLCCFLNGLALSPACRLFPKVQFEPKPPHVPDPENVVYRMHHHGQEYGFQKFHRDVVITHDPEREVVLADRWGLLFLERMQQTQVTQLSSSQHLAGVRVSGFFILLYIDPTAVCSRSLYV